MRPSIAASMGIVGSIKESRVRTAARIGVVGAGWWVTENHLPLLKDRTDVEFAGVCRRNPEQLQRVKERFGFEFATADYQEMLEKASLDGVIVGSPHNVSTTSTPRRRWRRPCRGCPGSPGRSSALSSA